MDKNTNQLPEGVKWPCYEDGTPVKFGDVIDNGTGHFPVRSFRFREDCWAIYDNEIAANAEFAETGSYGDFATRYVEPDSWDKWCKDALTLRYDGQCAYFGKDGKPCDNCPALNYCDCDECAVNDLKKRAIALAKGEK